MPGSHAFRTDAPTGLAPLPTLRTSTDRQKLCANEMCIASVTLAVVVFVNAAHDTSRMTHECWLTVILATLVPGLRALALPRFQDNFPLLPATAFRHAAGNVHPLRFSLLPVAALPHACAHTQFCCAHVVITTCSWPAPLCHVHGMLHVEIKWVASRTETKLSTTPRDFFTAALSAPRFRWSLRTLVSSKTFHGQHSRHSLLHASALPQRPGHCLWQHCAWGGGRLTQVITALRP